MDSEFEWSVFKPPLYLAYSHNFPNFSVFNPMSTTVDPSSGPMSTISFEQFDFSNIDKTKTLNGTIKEYIK